MSGKLTIMMILVLVLSGGIAHAQASPEELKPGEDFSVTVEEVQSNVENEVAMRALEVRTEDDPSAVVEEAKDLEGEVEKVREERQELIKQLQEGEITGRQFAVKQAKLNVQQNAVADRMEQTEEISKENGIEIAMEKVGKHSVRDVSSYLEFASKVSSGEISGQEVAENAKQLPGFAVGPPEDKVEEKGNKSPNEDVPSDGGVEEGDENVEDNDEVEETDDVEGEASGSSPSERGGPR